MPRSYFPAARPGMIPSNDAFLTLAFRPMTLARAFARSASIPRTVLSPGFRNSFGGYVASAATVSVPLLLIAAGTCAATAESFVAVVEPPELEPVLVLSLSLLLPHAASASASATTSTSSDAGLLYLNSSLLIDLRHPRRARI